MNPKIQFFLAPTETLSRQFYFHDCIALAEGFRELGIEFRGNINYWQEPETTSFLIQQAADSFRSTINIFSIYYFQNNPKKYSEIDPDKINIVLDTNDGIGILCYSPELQDADLILRAHYHREQSYPNFVKPWAFGLTHRIIRELQKTESLKPEERVFSSFRHDHNLRRLALAHMNPIIKNRYVIYEKTSESTMADDQISNEQTKGRHDRNYFQRLNQSLLTYCFGGNYQLKMPLYRDLPSRLRKKWIQTREKLLRQMIRPQTYDEYLNFIARYQQYYYINQFDSWRLWESLVSNSVPIHLDFEENGFVLPVMPENFKHYWGVTGLNFEQSAIALLEANRDHLETIAFAGKQWALKHYSPIAQAQRLLNYLKP
jgi:hypothetical protein